MAAHADLERLERKSRRDDAAPTAAHHEPRVDMLAALQRSAGNAAVARMVEQQRPKQEQRPKRELRPEQEPPPAASGAMETHTHTQSCQFGAAIRIGAQRHRPPPQGVALGADHDLPTDMQPHDELQEIEAIAGEPLAATTMAPKSAPASGPKGPPKAAAEGEAAEQKEETVSLPDIVVHDFENVDFCDAITPWLSYEPSISQGGAPPDGYGVTRSQGLAMTGITVRKVPLLGWWYVNATLTQQIQWQVQADRGPRGEINIMSATDPAITANNWSAVSDDLEPDYSDLSGRPPRQRYWAKDLTIQHEEFHANDRKERSVAALSLASTWLGTQQAQTEEEVQTLLATVPGRVAAVVAAGMAFPGREHRAYADGKFGYFKRSLAISTLGLANYYE
jgi:hypothetical protein